MNGYNEALWNEYAPVAQAAVVVHLDVTSSRVKSLQIVIFEKRPRWTPELERQFSGEDVRIRGFRDVHDLEVVQRGVQTSAAILDLEGGAAECLQFLGRLVHKPSGVAVLVVGSNQTRTLEWSFRELGALHFVWGHISGDDLAAFCRRQSVISKPCSPTPMPENHPANAFTE